MKNKILLVEDETTLAEIIAYALEDKGFNVDIAHDGKAGLDKYKYFNPDIIITDIMMPNLDGFSFVEELRKMGIDVPILFLSARSASEDVVHGFEIGGNDYLRKPFDMNELIARVKSLLGRNAKKTEKHIFKIGSFSFDSSNCTISDSDSKKKISQRESDVLLELCRNIEETVTSKSILVNLWGEDNYYNSCSLQVYITKLRNIFSTDSNVKIVNHRGVGYKLTINTNN